MKSSSLTVEQSRKRIVEDIEAILNDKQKGVSQNHLAKKMGISASQLFNIRNTEKWDKISDKLWSNVETYFQRSNEWKTIETTNFRLINEICKDSQLNHGLLCVVGKSGLGKTTALKAYAHSNSNAHYVLVDCHQKSKDFFRSILLSLNVEASGNARHMLQLIVDKVNTLKSPLVILDDAGKLNDGNYKNIQLLFDSTEGKLGIVLSGTLYLQEYVNKMTLKGKMGFDEFKRRVEYWLKLKEPRYDEVELMCHLQGVTCTDCINYLNNTLHDFGTIKSTLVRAGRTKKEITPQLLAALRS